MACPQTLQTAQVHRPDAGRREDGGAVPPVRHLAQDRATKSSCYDEIGVEGLANREITSAVDLKFLQIFCTHVKELQIQKTALES
jgi:hypothetical protein